MVTTLYLIRHGETEGGEIRRYKGTIDVPLSEKGVKQMENVAEYLIRITGHELEGTKLKAIYTSNLSRAIKSADIIAESYSLKPVIVPELRERNFGIWEGLSFEEIKDGYPEEFEAWTGNPLKFSPIGGESTLDVRERVVKVLDEIIGNHNGKHIAIISHGGVNRIILCHFLDIPLENIFRIEQNFSALNIIEFWDKYPVVKLINGIINKAIAKVHFTLHPYPQGEEGASNIPSPPAGESKGEGENLCSDVRHGGNIYRLAEELKIQERKIIDFSASVNPIGVSKKVKTEIRKHLKYLHNYPDPGTKRLRKRLAQYHGIDPEIILCGNGSTELIYLITRALKPKNVLITAPTFSEYERACQISSELRVLSYELKKENNFEINPDEFINAMGGRGWINNSSLITHHSSLPCDMAFLCNPNNPTGRLLKKDIVLGIAEAARDLKCILVVDEAFIDFCPEDSVIKEVENNPYLIVLRSMTKFYALSGLRLGYGVFPQHLIGRLKEYKEPWTVNNLAQRAAVVAVKDKVYRNETFRLIKEEKRFLEKGFKKLGIEFFHSDANFYLLKISNADEICQQLRKKYLLVRDCSNFIGLDSTYIRVAVKSHRENTVLLKELVGMLQNGGENKFKV